MDKTNLKSWVYSGGKFVLYFLIIWYIYFLIAGFSEGIISGNPGVDGTAYRGFPMIESASGGCGWGGSCPTFPAAHGIFNLLFSLWVGLFFSFLLVKKGVIKGLKQVGIYIAGLFGTFFFLYFASQLISDFFSVPSIFIADYNWLAPREKFQRLDVATLIVFHFVYFSSWLTYYIIKKIN